MINSKRGEAAGQQAEARARSTNEPDGKGTADAPPIEITEQNKEEFNKAALLIQKKYRSKKQGQEKTGQDAEHAPDKAEEGNKAVQEDEELNRAASLIQRKFRQKKGLQSAQEGEPEAPVQGSQKSLHSTRKSSTDRLSAGIGQQIQRSDSLSNQLGVS